jgi:hypothetical protein
VLVKDPNSLDISSSVRSPRADLARAATLDESNCQRAGLRNTNSA